MKQQYLINFLAIFAILTMAIGTPKGQAQQATTSTPPSFWSKVRFGGNLSVSFAKNRTSVVVSPNAIYQFDNKFSAGLGINFGYNEGLNFEDYIYGTSLISLYTPVRGLQLSAEFEETGVSRTIETTIGNVRDSYWYPSLFLGAGYQLGGVTVGLRYDVLYDESKSIYATAFLPFFRVFF